MQFCSFRDQIKNFCFFFTCRHRPNRKHKQCLHSFANIEANNIKRNNDEQIRAVHFCKTDEFIIWFEKDNRFRFTDNGCCWWTDEKQITYNVTKEFGVGNIREYCRIWRLCRRMDNHINTTEWAFFNRDRCKRLSQYFLKINIDFGWVEKFVMMSCHFPNYFPFRIIQLLYKLGKINRWLTRIMNFKRVVI